MPEALSGEMLADPVVWSTKTALQLQQESQGGGAQSAGLWRTSLKHVAASSSDPREGVDTGARSRKAC
jgi:hypothetical protein